MAVSSTLPLPQKDFKAVVRKGRIQKVGVEFFDEAVSAQALYHLKKEDWRIWLDQICAFCESGQDGCYAENALNQVTDRQRAFGALPFSCIQKRSPEGDLFFRRSKYSFSSVSFV